MEVAVRAATMVRFSLDVFVILSCMAARVFVKSFHGSKSFCYAAFTPGFFSHQNVSANKFNEPVLKCEQCDDAVTIFTFITFQHNQTPQNGDIFCSLNVFGDTVR